ncbi:MAG: hypothetical protein A2268_14870 [Candidatus Raymondbacteria bacterium RifOxyA12_full_50_37]|uniref:O-antigen polymerase n=1 Tax=Candidatus Raymondbacteria bacterium RIFOXYD12_FULL_49_13 TaxID=1817890 RepID=A0A1F7F2I0_UNCRA|nr:MAG: hypothetical protein A2268_14870 [Candidatus Raymondbacteria bacterium RifOxyA12_full_50_37]OGJ87843.1 MAG: hypothetical protein A2350_12815 [Candidatus Raymondbacteria bacterium RifOxyB12_full_50_8]OGJ88697.1 MAG: hypothetical protein A2248_20805 [Candidatus Raymondbacteria bacterium RIFOXYA2_FULL_49_16]OGK00869.1 MAG: hypothetical protein A2519_08060 [Candidatus Raymondbacteria bacterium RIFOXYD12_FULL_49_13]OGK07496.1 MAG: hypothetical protein A2487_19975 [Candidatus Raymondbacteria 
MNLLSDDQKGGIDTSRLLPAVLFVALAVTAGQLIAKKIFDIPTRRDVLVFFILCCAIPVLKFPRLGIYLLFAFVPFIPLIRRVYYLLYVRPTNDLLLLIPDAIIAFLTLVYFDRLRKREKTFLEDPAVGPLLWIYFVYQLIRCFVANTVSMTDGLHEFKFAALYILCFFFTAHFISSARQVVTCFKIIAFIGFAASLYGIKQLIFGYSTFEILWLDVMREKFVTLFIGGNARPFSIFASPACLADYMLISMTACLCLYLIDKSRARVLYLVTIPFMISALLITSVRSNWTGLLAGIVFWFLMAQRSTVKIKVVLLTIVVIVFMAGSTLLELFTGGTQGFDAFLLQGATSQRKQEKTLTDLLVTDRISAVTNPFEEYSMVSRFSMWQMVARNSIILPQGPIGWGTGSFDAHSYYFSTLYWLGYPGLVLAFIIMIRIFLVGFRIYFDEEERVKRVIIQGCLTMFFMFCVINTTGTHIASHPGDLVFWFCAGVLMVIHRIEGMEKSTVNARIVDAT